MILVDPDELRIKAEQLRSYAQQDDKIIEQLTNPTISLEETWDGEAQPAFVLRFQNSRPKLTSFITALKHLAQVMETAANKMEDKYVSLKQRVNGIM